MLARALHVRPFARSFTSPLAMFERHVEQMFDRPPQSAPSAQWLALNVSETEHAFVVTAELPGFSPEHVDVQVEGDLLTISAQRQTTLPEGSRVLRQERGSVSCSRSLRFAAGLDSSNVSAKLVSGVLTVTLPKQEKVRARKIAIEAGPGSARS